MHRRGEDRPDETAGDRIAGDADDDLLAEIAQRGAAHCPVCDAVKRTVPVEVEVATG